MTERVRIRPRDEEDDYDVGYGKPPRAGQFRPGQSGNPKGRPKGARSFAPEVQALLKAPVKVIRDGKAEQVSTQEGTLWRLREKALSGDLSALKLLLGLAQSYGSNDGNAAPAALNHDEKEAFRVLVQRLTSGAIPIDEENKEDGGEHEKDG